MNCPTYHASLAEGRFAHDGLDAAYDQSLKLLGPGEIAVLFIGTRIVAEGGQPGFSAVIILAPGDWVKAAVSGMTTNNGLHARRKTGRECTRGRARLLDRRAVALLVDRREK